jgi:hypothetical protein
MQLNVTWNLLQVQTNYHTVWLPVEAKRIHLKGITCDEHRQFQVTKQFYFSSFIWMRASHKTELRKYSLHNSVLNWIRISWSDNDDNNIVPNKLV